MTTQKLARAWIVDNDTGMSSKAIWAHMMGTKPRDGWATPRDPADFGRCARLLKLIPAWRKRLPEMAGRSRQWRKLVKHWDEIHAVMEAEVGIDWSKGGKAPMTYDLMKKIGC